MPMPPMTRSEIFSMPTVACQRTGSSSSLTKLDATPRSREVMPAEVVDLTFLREAQAELGVKGR